MKFPYLLAGILLLVASCKDKPTPTWSIKATTSGRICFDSERRYSFGILKLECTEYSSSSSGPALIQEFTNCYVRFPDKPLLEKSILGANESCEVKDGDKIYLFNGYTGNKALVTVSEIKLEMSCQDSRDLIERDDVSNCQEYLKSRFK